MGKFEMPTVQQFLAKKRLYSKKKDLEWEYIEKEMLENINKKPYNEKVHKWLVFLKELRHYYHAQSKKKERRLINEAGPAWYVELSSSQRNVLAHLKASIHQDILEDVPRRIRSALNDLGVTLRIPKKILMATMDGSYEDPGVFIWNLYKAVYNQSPSDLRNKYDMNAKILMSSLVFIDLDECVESLEKLTHYKNTPTVPKVPKQKKYFQPNVKYGEYLQRIYIPLYTTVKKKKKQTPLPLGNKLRLRSDESYENLIKDTRFLEKRMKRNIQEKEKERICTYKFWEPPSTLRNVDPKMAAYGKKLRMTRMKAKMKYKAPFKNVQYLVGGVSYTGGVPNYTLANVSLLPTGFIPINGGIAMFNGAAVTSIVGYWRYPLTEKKTCEITCNCLTKWETAIMEYLNESKCRCGHRYDFFNEGKSKEKYFHQSTRHGKYWLDKAKIYQMDPMGDFIKDAINEALNGVPTPSSVAPTLCASGLKERDLLAAFLADLSDTPLLIPHLPQANLLNNLQEWVRNRLKGPLTPKDHKRMLLKSQRRWLDLKHMDHRARAYSIPFTLKQLHHFNWSHRYMVQRLFDILLNDFVSRNRLKQVEQTRLWWPTTKYDCYPNKPFLDIFFTYLPGRTKDTYFINPYSSALTPKSGAKTCPLVF